MMNSMKNLIVISTLLMGLFGIVRAEEATEVTKTRLNKMQHEVPPLYGIIQNLIKTMKTELFWKFHIFDIFYFSISFCSGRIVSRANRLAFNLKTPPASRS